MQLPKLYCALSLVLFSLCLVAQPPSADAGPYRKLCPDYGSTTLGGSPTASGGVAPYTYSWSPAGSVSTATVANPATSTTVTTTFTVVVRGSNGELKSDTVTVAVYPYSINAGKDTSIKQGQTITLLGQAAGATQVSWTPSPYSIYNPNSLKPDVFPPVTTTYTLTAVYPGGCTLEDYVTVTVRATDELFFFNTFSPNGDGANDYFIIGNIEKYPENVLEIYNRYGQKVLTKIGYHNDWDGKYLNQELPSGTYFYILDTKSEKGGKYHGHVNLIR
jgi:gliding motility-associated-like protein